VIVPGHADAYDGLEVQYIQSHVPELVMFDNDGSDGERIALSPYDDVGDGSAAAALAGLHGLLSDKGFKRKADGPFPKAVEDGSWQPEEEDDDGGGEGEWEGGEDEERGGDEDEDGYEDDGYEDGYEDEDDGGPRDL
jgi:hypothetical protein